MCGGEGGTGGSTSPCWAGRWVVTSLEHGPLLGQGPLVARQAGQSYMKPHRMWQQPPKQAAVKDKGGGPCPAAGTEHQLLQADNIALPTSDSPPHPTPHHTPHTTPHHPAPPCHPAPSCPAPHHTTTPPRTGG